MSETALTKKIMSLIDTMRRNGESIKAKKLHGSQFQTAGDPDIFVVYEGFAMFMEIKIGNNPPTKLQLHKIDEWTDAGACAQIVRSVAAAEMFLERSLQKMTARLTNLPLGTREEIE